VTGTSANHNKSPAAAGLFYAETVFFNVGAASSRDGAFHHLDRGKMPLPQGR
jgi:hypothetical protein